MLNETQCRQFDERGFLILPGALVEDEVAILDAAVGDLAQRDGPEVAREADGSPHVIYGVHLWDGRIAALAGHPAIHEPARQLLGGRFFIHQSRLNLKQTGGSVVAWHQDFATYHRVDGIPEARGLVIGVLIDTVGAANAPVIVLPGSHRGGIVSEAVIDGAASDHEGAARYRYDISLATIARLAAAAEPEAVLGPAGTVFLMHANLVHGSSVNILPARRAIAYVNVSPCDNRGESFTRPEYYAARDFEPLELSPPDCLRRAQM